MQINIPEELMEYVRMAPNEGLVHESNMPDELLPLFEKTKSKIIRIQDEQRKRLESLISEEED